MGSQLVAATTHPVHLETQLGLEMLQSLPYGRTTHAQHRPQSLTGMELAISQHL